MILIVQAQYISTQEALGPVFTSTIHFSFSNIDMSIGFFKKNSEECIICSVLYFLDYAGIGRDYYLSNREHRVIFRKKKKNSIYTFDTQHFEDKI